jgi:CDGSH-type Zn-finger protein
MSSAKKPLSVVVSKDGPYIVAGDAPLTEQVIVANAEGDSLQWREGSAYEAPAKYALCRCGHSHKAPFCDGTHAKIGFDGTETAPRSPYSEQATVFDGPVLALLDAQRLCAYGRFCDPNGKVPFAIGLIEDPVEDCSGPIWLRGGVSLTSADGYDYEVRNRMTVCRCGASKNKPFCDGSHASIGFKAQTKV